MPSGPASSWEYRAAQSSQARPEEAQGPSWGAAKGGTLALLQDLVPLAIGPLELHDECGIGQLDGLEDGAELALVHLRVQVVPGSGSGSGSACSARTA